jgi:hypothetical protein
MTSCFWEPLSKEWAAEIRDAPPRDVVPAQAEARNDPHNAAAPDVHDVSLSVRVNATQETTAEYLQNNDFIDGT